VERRFVGIKYLSEYLGIPKGTLYVWTCYKKIPHFKIGRIVKFDLKEIEKWLKDKKVEEIS